MPQTLRTVLAILPALALAATAPSAVRADKPAKLFATDDGAEMQITLEGPWRDLERSREEDPRFPATIRWTGEDNYERSLDIEVGPRGLTRRYKVCKFPPLKLYFDKETSRDTPFRGNKSLKLVTYCAKNRRYEPYVLKEFIAYRIFNLVTPYSYRVRPLTITYADSETGGEPLVKFGFLIEDVDEVADRFDLEKLEIDEVSPSRLDPAETALFALTQLLIGNVDWAATGAIESADHCCHNARLIATAPDASPVFAIAYDFDSSGLVDAHYAAPPQGLRGVNRVTDRRYRGFCKHNDALPAAREKINALREEVLNLVRDETRLGGKAQSEAIEFLEEYYEDVNDPGYWEKEVLGRCRG